jgi:hypothetical protein
MSWQALTSWFSSDAASEAFFWMLPARLSSWDVASEVARLFAVNSGKTTEIGILY